MSRLMARHGVKTYNLSDVIHGIHTFAGECRTNSRTYVAVHLDKASAQNNRNASTQVREKEKNKQDINNTLCRMRISL